MEFTGTTRRTTLRSTLGVGEQAKTAHPTLPLTLTAEEDARSAARHNPVQFVLRSTCGSVVVVVSCFRQGRTGHKHLFWSGSSVALSLHSPPQHDRYYVQNPPPQQQQYTI